MLFVTLNTLMRTKNVVFIAMEFSYDVTEDKVTLLTLIKNLGSTLVLALLGESM